VVKNAANSNPGLISSVAAIIVLPDVDGDHIPDGWETQHGFNPTNSADALIDSDGDGMTAWQEYTAGTDPRDNTSYLKLEAARNGNGVTLSFNATSTKTYTVLSCERLGGNPWQRLADFAATPTNRVVTFSPPSGLSERYYRLATPQQP